MDGLFSDAPDPAVHPGTHPTPPENWTIELPVGMMQAAQGFLDYLHLWWPTSLYSVGGAGGQLWWDAERLVEETDDGESIVWATTEVWDPPLTVSCELSLPGVSGDRWVFTVEPGSGVSHVHFRAPRPRRLPGTGDSATERGGIPDDFWGSVLGFYGRFMGASAAPERS
ncbi:MAG: hypothetical protein ACTIJJ_12430 [Galactobacter sp.]|uniref:hypothetical protein n=1 Tax=Galactobacter sp. TaxID=2676125 RepID=UPI0025C2AB72|nr:hypothetical protein [Galactobacter sp.]